MATHAQTHGNTTPTHARANKFYARIGTLVRAHTRAYTHSDTHADTRTLYLSTWLQTNHSGAALNAPQQLKALARQGTTTATQCTFEGTCEAGHNHRLATATFEVTCDAGHNHRHNMLLQQGTQPLLHDSIAAMRVLGGPVVFLLCACCRLDFVSQCDKHVITHIWHRMT